MLWSSRPRKVRDGFGVVGSAGFTALVFGVAPICALLWGFGPSPRAEALLVQQTFPHEAVTLAWDSLTDVASEGEEEGDSVDEDGPLKAGPNPDDPSSGDGTADAQVEESGEDGADDRTDPTLDGVRDAPHPTVADRSRTVRGVRTPGANGARVPGVPRIGALGRRGHRRRACKSSHPDVEKTGPEAWTVNRNLVEYYTSSFKRFNSLGWSGPYNNEVIKGWKIGGFGCNSPLHFAGLRRGDIVLSVNNKKTRNWLQIFGAYTRLKRNDDFEVVVIRRGERKVLHYRLIEAGPPTTG